MIIFKYRKTTSNKLEAYFSLWFLGKHDAALGFRLHGDTLHKHAVVQWLERSEQVRLEK